jgi:hypothetical protein
MILLAPPSLAAVAYSRLWRTTLILIPAAVFAEVPAAAASPAPAPHVELVGHAVLPAHTFAEGPPSGAFDSAGNRLPAPRFASQPVQGFSSLRAISAAPSVVRALSDNGYGGKWNSPDFRLRLHRLELAPARTTGARGTVTPRDWIELSDPDHHLPFLIANETVQGRPLTGWDLDPESLALMPDGTFWIGDEFGPWLVHVGADGRVLAPPVATPDLGAAGNPGRDEVRSPQHPRVVAGAARATVGGSRGFEGIDRCPDTGRIYALLEGPVDGDPKTHLRLHAFDPQAGRFTGEWWHYPLDVERDSRFGPEARYKRVHRVRLEGNGRPPPGAAPAVLRKEVLVDLLDIADPRGLGGEGTIAGRFRFPYVTIEAVLSVGADELLIVNDNNYPGTGGRSPTVADVSEFIWLRLGAPLLAR